MTNAACSARARKGKVGEFHRAIGRTISATVPLLILAACDGGSSRVQPEASTWVQEAHRDQETRTALIQAWYAENSVCRGTSGPETQLACDRRNQLGQRLRAVGWCYGENAQFGYQAEWAACREQNTGLTDGERERARRMAYEQRNYWRLQAEADRQIAAAEAAEMERNLRALEQMGSLDSSE